MNQNLSDWDEDLPPEPQEVYQDLLRALKRKAGFGLFFVQCTPAESDNFIAKLPQDIPQKKIAVLRLVEPIDNLYQRVAEFVKDKQVDILLIKGLEYSLYKYEQRTFGEITEGQFSNLASVPPILNHLNQQRERFRDDFPISFVFLLRSFSINYLIHRAPDFFDWRSGVFELPTTPEVVEEESSRLLDEADYEEYLKLSQEKKIEKVLGIQDLLREKHQAESRKANLLRELGRLLATAKEYEAALTSYDKALEIKPDYHYAWYSRGNALYDLERYEEAIASYDKALEIKPDYHEAWSNRGHLLNNLERYEEAIASYDKALEIKPDYHFAWDSRGIALWILKRYEDAIASYDKALEIKPDDYLAWSSRGIALYHLERYKEAIASYDKAIEIKPDYHYVWDGRGIALWNLKRYEEAITSYDKAIEIKPDYYDAWYKRGIALRDLKCYEEAIASYDKAIEIKPDYHYAWYGRGTVLMNLKHYEQAIASYDKAIEIKHDYSEAWIQRGITLFKKQNITLILWNVIKQKIKIKEIEIVRFFAESLVSLTQPLQFNDFENQLKMLVKRNVLVKFLEPFKTRIRFITVHTMWYIRGIALGKLERYEEAIASYDKALEIKPGYHEAWNSRGDALVKLERYEEAIACFDKVLEIKPEDYGTWNNRGYLLLKPDSSEGMTAVYDKALEIGLYLRNLHNNLERYQEALSNFDKALELKPDYELTWANRSFSLYYLNKYEEALTSCKKAIDLKADDYVAWSNKGFALIKLERFEEAIISFDKVLKLQSDNHGAWYNKACCYALQGNVELALENLQQAINMSFEEYQQMAKTDSYFDDIRGSDCFQALIQ